MFSPPLFGELPAQTVVLDGSSVAAFLNDLGLDAAILQTALAYGEADAATVTAHATAPSYGQRFWDGTITSLRDQLAPQGWTVHRPGGLEVVRRADNRIQLTASMGTSDTGHASGWPDWKHERGVSTTNAVAANQLSLADLAPAVGVWSVQTWWLLYCVSNVHGERIVTAELSLPAGEVAGRPLWAYRLLLGEQHAGATPTAAIPEAAPEPTMGPLRRRNAP